MLKNGKRCPTMLSKRRNCSEEINADKFVAAYLKSIEY